MTTTQERCSTGPTGTPIELGDEHTSVRTRTDDTEQIFAPKKGSTEVVMRGYLTPVFLSDDDEAHASIMFECE